MDSIAYDVNSTSAVEFGRVWYYEIESVGLLFHSRECVVMLLAISEAH